MDIPTLIVDDHADIRLLMRLILEQADEGLTVAGEAANGQEALDRVDDCDPLVVVLDEMMPDMTGVETATRLRARRPAQIMILCSAYLDDGVLARARDAGVRACVSKEDLHELPDVIHRAVVTA